MITLATLADATAQQVFDQVKQHLLTQGVKSVDPLSCRYRCNNGTKCAAGCLISDEEYSADEMETITWLRLAEESMVTDAHSELIANLQRTHDAYEPEEWTYELRKIANRFNLQYEKDINIQQTH